MIYKSANLQTPTIYELSTVLSVTYEVMSGGFIQSNFIESKNCVIKQLILGEGLKNVYQYDYLLGAHLLAKNDIDRCYWNFSNIEGNFRSTLGFTYLLNFFQPDYRKIIINFSL